MKKENHSTLDDLHLIIIDKQHDRREDGKTYSPTKLTTLVFQKKQSPRRKGNLTLA